MYGWDPGVLVACYRAQSLWFVGDFDNDLREGQKGLQRADQLGTPFHRAVANGLLAMYRAYRGESNEAMSYAEATIKISGEYGIHHWLALGILLKGWALTQLNEGDEGIGFLQDGIARWKSTGAEMAVPTFLALQAEAYLSSGRVELGLRTINEALQISARNNERYYDAELHRLKGELWLRKKRGGWSTHGEEAEKLFRDALQVARKRNLKAHELRASNSLARLWQKTGKTKLAKNILKKSLGWFGERSDTPDLKAARTLLDGLSRMQPTNKFDW
jgi:predicted ATPase